MTSSRLGAKVQFVQEDGYSYGDGTSFSTPYVTGAAARLWQVCSPCTNQDILDCMQSSARDLGATGKDTLYGYGLVQIVDAYQCLVGENGCCNAAAASTATSTMSAPSIPPALAPSPTGSCTNEENNYISCLDTSLSFLDAQSCVDCLSPAIPYSIISTPCAQITTSICSALQNCSCGVCVPEIEKYLSCVVADSLSSFCQLDCSLQTSSSVVPVSGSQPTTAKPSIISTPLPTTLPSLTHVTNSPGAAPLTTKPTSQAVSPSPVLVTSTEMYPTIYPLSAFMTSPPSSSQSCATEIAAYQTCLTRNMTSGQAFYCRTCVDNHIPSGTTVGCSVISSQLCMALEVCSCDSCRIEIEAFLDCTFRQSNSCSLQCTAPNEPASLVNISPSQAPTNLKLAPTISPSQVCLSDALNYKSCFNASMSSAKSFSCQSCINSQLPTYVTDCNKTGSQLCSAIQTCDCVCQEQIYSYLNCAYAASAGCGFGSCTFSTESPTISAAITPVANIPLPTPMRAPTPRNPDAPTLSPTASTCLNQRQAFSQCSIDLLSVQEARDCSSCVISALHQSSVECTTLTANVCVAIETCSCGGCKAEIEDFVICSTARGRCPIQCTNNFTDASLLPTNSSTATQTPIQRSTSSARKAASTSQMIALAVALLCTLQLF